jgi:hypothetical protein
MALSFDQGAKLTQDVSFVQRVTMAMMRKAAEVTMQSPPDPLTVTYAKRQALANNIITSPSMAVNTFVYMVASDPNTALTWWDPQAIEASTDTDPVALTTPNAHGLSTGDIVEILDHANNPRVNGTHTVTVVDDTHFTIPVPGSAAGTGGSFQKMINDGDLFYTVSVLFDPAAGITPGE